MTDRLVTVHIPNRDGTVSIVRMTPAELQKMTAAAGPTAFCFSLRDAVELEYPAGSGHLELNSSDPEIADAFRRICGR